MMAASKRKPAGRGPASRQDVALRRVQELQKDLKLLHVEFQRVHAEKFAPSAMIREAERTSNIEYDESAARIVERTLFMQVGASGTLKSADQVLFRIEVGLALLYELPEGLDLTKEDLAMFGRVTARFHAWPFFREALYSEMARMDLTPPVLPLVTVWSLGVSAAAEAEQERAAAEPEPAKPGSSEEAPAKGDSRASGSARPSGSR